VVGPKATRHGIVAIDPYAARLDVILGYGRVGTYNGIPRIVVPYSCGVGWSMQGDQQGRSTTQRDNYSTTGRAQPRRHSRLRSPGSRRPQ
jgi:hypothetical protein